MPRRKKRRTGGRRKFFRRRKFGRKSFVGRGGRRSKVIIKTPSAIADTVFVKLRVADTYLFTMGSGGIVYNRFRGNSIFDPDYEVGGLQPLAYDQWNAFYGRYCCFGSKLTVTYLNISNNTAATGTTEVLIGPSHDATAITDMDTATMQPYFHRSLMSYLGNGSKVKQKAYMSTAKIFGVKRIAPDIDEAYASDFGANPTNEWYWHVATQPADHLATQSLRVYISITYYCRLYHRKTLPLSS